MVFAAARLIHFRSAHDDDGVVVVGRLAVHQPLRAAGVFAAYHADGVQFIHLLGLRRERGHGAEGLAAEVGIETRHDHPHALVGQPIHNCDDLRIQELRLVDGHHGGIVLQLRPDVGGLLDGDGVEFGSGMRHDLGLRIAVVDPGLEDLDLLLGDLGPPQAPDQLVGLAAEHRAGDDFQGTLMSVHRRKFTTGQPLRARTAGVAIPKIVCKLARGLLRRRFSARHSLTCHFERGANRPHRNDKLFL